MMEYPTPRSIIYLALFVVPLSQLAVLFLDFHSPQLGLIIAEATLIATTLVFLRRKKPLVEDFLLLNATSKSTLFFSFLLAASASVLIAEFDLSAREFLDYLGYSLPLSFQYSSIKLQVVRDMPGLCLGLLAAVVAPGICEEVFFRGLAFTGIYFYYGRRAAVWSSAAMFTLLHFNPWQLPSLLLFGAFLGLIVCWSHSLYPAILAHMVNNLFSFVSVNAEAYWNVDLLCSHQHLPLYILICALLLFGICWALLRQQVPIMPLPPTLQHRPLPYLTPSL